MCQGEWLGVGISSSVSRATAAAARRDASDGWTLREACLPHPGGLSISLTIDRPRQPGHVATQSFEPTPVPGGNGNIGMQTHAGVSNATRGRPIICVDAALPGFDRLDPFAKPPPGGASEACESGEACESPGLVAIRERMEAALRASRRAARRSTSGDPRPLRDGVARASGQSAGRWPPQGEPLLQSPAGERNERPEFVRGSGIDPVELERMKSVGLRFRADDGWLSPRKCRDFRALQLRRHESRTSCDAAGGRLQVLLLERGGVKIPLGIEPAQS